MLARLFLVCGLLAALPAASPAALIIGNYPPANDAGGISTSGGSFTVAYATAFTMVGGYDLSSATERLFVSIPGITVQGGIFSDAGGNPDALLFALTAPAVPTGSYQDVTFTALGPAPLTGGTTYWLVTTFTAPAGGIAWAAGNPPITATGPGAVHAYVFRFEVNGNGWVSLLGSSRPTYQLDGVPTANAVPAPAGLVLAGLGLPALALVRRRLVAA